MLVQEPIQKIQMLQESFSPAEAREIISSMIEPYLKYYNLKYMRSWEVNHGFDSTAIERKINRLKSMKRELEDSIRRAEAQGKRLNLESLLDLRLS